MACMCGGSHPANMPCQYHLEETERRFRESRGIGMGSEVFKPIEPIKPIMPIMPITFPHKKDRFSL